MDQLITSSHTHGELQKRGKLVNFFRNGDKYFKGVTIPISQKWFMTLETLIEYLNEKISTPAGIRHIFQLPNGEEIKDVTYFIPGASYVVSSVKIFNHNIRYGERLESYWINKPLSASKIRKNDHCLFAKDCNDICQLQMSQISLRDNKKKEIASTYSELQKNRFKMSLERQIIIMSNSNRSSFYMLTISRESTIKLEDILYGVSNFLKLSNPPIQTLYTTSKPYKRVVRYGELFKEFINEERFIACGLEFTPQEMKRIPNKVNVPQIHSQTENLEVSKNVKLNYSTNSCKSTSTQTFEIFSQNENDKIINLPTTKLKVKDIPVTPQSITINEKERQVYSSKYPTSAMYKSEDVSYSLSLNWIYGFNSNMLCNCLAVINSNEILYSVGKIIIIYDVTCCKQRYFIQHTSAISCFTVHSNRRYVASSQVESNSGSFVFIWDVNECNVLTVITDSLLENIFSLDFSSEATGKYLMILDRNNKEQIQTLKIYDWQNNVKVALTKCNKEEIIAGRFQSEDNSTIVTYGYQHLNIWRIFWEDKGLTKILRDRKSGIFKFCIPEYVTCVSFYFMSSILTGDSNGSIHLWSKDDEEAYMNCTVPHLFHAHKDGVSCILLVGDGTMITASNNSIKAWDSFNDFKFIKERNIPEKYGKIKTVASSHPERISGKLWIATENSIVLEGTLQDTFTVLFQNHGYTKHPIQISTSPVDHCFITGGQDNLLIKWSIFQQRVFWTSSIEGGCSSIAYYKDGQHASIGTFSGQLIIVHCKTGRQVMSVQVDPYHNKITCLQYSPDGQFLCIGCSKSNVIMFSILDQGAFCRRLMNIDIKNSVNVLRIDWSVDCQTIRTEDKDFNTKIWSVFPVLKERGALGMNQFEFSTENCLVTFNNLDLWRSPSIKELSVATKAKNIDQIIFGTVNGAIGLFQCPLRSKAIDVQAITANIGKIGSIGVLFDDSYVLSSCVDTNCSSVFQWIIMENKNANCNT